MSSLIVTVRISDVACYRKRLGAIVEICYLEAEVLLEADEVFS